MSEIEQAKLFIKETEYTCNGTVMAARGLLSSLTASLAEARRELEKYEGASEHQCVVSESNTGNATREWIYLDACALIGQPVTVWVKKQTKGEN